MDIEIRLALLARLNARAGAQEIAVALGVRAHTVRRMVQKFLEQRIFRPYVLVNPAAFGLTDYCLFLNLHTDVRQASYSFQEYCEQSPLVAYSGELAGEYQFSVSLFASTPYEAQDFLSQLSNRFPNSSISARLAIRLSWEQKCGFACRKKNIATELVRGRVAHVVELTAVDKRILGHLSRYPEDSLIGTARTLGIPESTIRARLNALMAEGVIVGYGYQVEWSRLGMLDCRLLFRLRGPREIGEVAVRTFCANNESVTAIVFCLGEWSGELNVLVHSPVELSALVQEFQTSLANCLDSVRCVTDLAVRTLPRVPRALVA